MSGGRRVLRTLRNSPMAEESPGRLPGSRDFVLLPRLLLITAVLLILAAGLKSILF